MGNVTIGRHTIELCNEDKVLFSDAGITKGELIDYYREMADTVLPWLEERPLSMERSPDGIDAQTFYEKKRPDYYPDWIGAVTVPLRKGGSQPEVLCNDTATLVFLADQAVITPHTWLSRADKLNHPDRLIFDLDPPGDDFARVRKAAKQLRGLLNELGLPAYAMITGSRGVHLVTPLDRSQDFDTARTFAQDLAELAAARHPHALTTAARKSKRGDRLYLDTARNAYAQTAVPPYTVRTRPGAPVAVPVDWDELAHSSLVPHKYTIKNVRRRLSQKEDPWEDFFRHARSLKKPRQALDGLREEADMG